MHIKSIDAIEILDSRGVPSIHTSVVLNSGHKGEAMVPSGASTGKKEAFELRDNDERFDGKGTKKAIENIKSLIQPALLGKPIEEQKELDQIMINLDGTREKKKLGANSILSVSLACTRAAANAMNLPLYDYIRILFNSKSDKGSTLSMPKPMLNIFNGGAHSNNRIDIQEFMIMPSGDVSFSEGLKNCVQVYTSLKRLLSSKGWSTNVGDEGGFAPNLDSNEEVIEYLIKAIQSANFSYGKDIFISLDCAASEFFDGRNYILNATDETFSSDGLIDYYVKLIKKFDIKSIEDPLHEDDWDGWIKLTSELNGVQIVGDDIFVTQRELLKKGIDSHAGNAILIKPNQVGTLTESLESIQYNNKAVLTNATVYFEFDKSSLTSRSLQILKSVVEALSENPSVTVTLAGHADERGTREYNLALGERRANAAKDYLMTYGVSSDRIKVLSYGKERPVDSGSNPLSWSKNRRSVTVKAN